MKQQQGRICGDFNTDCFPQTMSAPKRKVWVDSWTLHSTPGKQSSSPAKIETEQGHATRTDVAPEQPQGQSTNDQPIVDTIDNQRQKVKISSPNLNLRTAAQENSRAENLSAIKETSVEYQTRTVSPVKNATDSKPIVDNVTSSPMEITTVVGTNKHKADGAREDASPSPLLVSNIVAAPRPARNQLLESRWATSVPGKQPAFRKSSNVSHHLPLPSSGRDVQKNDTPAQPSGNKSSPIQTTTHLDGSRKDGSGLEEHTIALVEKTRPEAISLDRNLASDPTPGVPGYVAPNGDRENLRGLDQQSRPSESRKSTTDFPASQQPKAHTTYQGASFQSNKTSHPSVIDGLVEKTGAFSDQADSNVWINNVSYDDDKEIMSPDVRGKVPEELWTEQDWNNTRRPKPKKDWETDEADEDEFTPPTYLVRWIESWLQKVPSGKANFLEDKVTEHWFHDVNPVTGRLLAAYEQPFCMESTFDFL